MSDYQQFLAKEQQYGLPAGYLSRTAQIESSGNPNAANPRSSAKGLFQFIDSTAAQYGLSDPFDPVASTDAAARYAADNAEYLRRRLGREPTAGELYLAHQQGAGGAVKLLSNPDAPASSVVGEAEAGLNGGGGKTAGQLASQWTGKFDVAGGGSEMIGGAGDTMAYGNPAADELNPMPETEGGLGGLGGFLDSGNGGDLLQAIGYSLMGSDRRTPLGDVGKYLPALQDRRMKQDLLQEEKAKENKTLGFLRQSFPEIAAQVDAGLPVSEAFKMAQAERLAKAKGPESTTDMQNYQFAQANPGFNDYLTRNSTTGRLSTQPVYGLDKDGNTVLGQLSNDGKFVPSNLPEGVRPLSPQELNAQKAAGTTLGQAETERSLSAPSDVQSAQNALDLIDNIRNDPYRERGTGASSVLNSVPGTGGYDFAGKVQQAKSGAFLTAIQQMKGMGALSNTEGTAATAAITRMDTASSEQGFLDALKDYEKIVNQAMSRAQKNAGTGAAAPSVASPSAAPAAAEDPLGLR